MTNKSLSDRRFVNNFNLKNAIEEYCSHQETILSSNQFLTFNICYGHTPIEWNDKPTLKIRLSLLGGSNVGKTTLAHYLRYGTQSNFVHLKSTATVGPDLFFFYLDQLYENKYVIIIQLTDIPGMERYESCCDNHFRNCHGALLLCDSTDIDTLEHVELYWYKQLQLKGKKYVESVLICNKIDLFEENCDEDYRKIFFQRIEQFASINNMSIYHTSAIRGDNIQMMFKQLILSIIQNELLFEQIKGIEIIDDESLTGKGRSRNSPTIQVSLQSLSRQNQSEANLSRNCCTIS
jgi:GTPase SAR1 family protein